MTTRVVVDPRATVGAFADMIRREPEVESLWVTIDAERATLWLWIKDAPLDREHVFFEHWARFAADHPELQTRLHVTNPRFHDETTSFESFIPTDA